MIKFNHKNRIMNSFISRKNISSRLFFLGLFLSLFFAFSARAQDATTNSAVEDLVNQALSGSDANTKVITNEISSETATEPAADEAASADSSAAETVESFLEITGPKSNEIMVNTNARISGKTVPGVLVEVMVSDEDLHKRFFRHTNPARVSGTTTSDKNGDWVYVPQVALAPGEYSVSASYKDPQKGAINSEVVYFAVSDSSGATAVPLMDRRWAAGSIAAFALVVAAIFFFWVRARKRKKESFDFNKKDFENLGSQGPGRSSEKGRAAAKILKHELIGASKELHETIRDLNNLEEEIDGIAEKKSSGKKEKGKNMRESARKVERELIEATNAVNDAIEEADELEEEVREK